MSPGGGRGKRHAVVVGAGIGGLTAALGLLRAGWEVTILDRAPEPSEIGAGIQIAPNATRVLIALGLRARLEAVAVTPLEQVRRRWQDGSVIAVRPMGETVERRYGAPYWQFHRGELFRALLDACLIPEDERAAATLVADCTVVGVENFSGGAVAVAADGSRFRADVVIGADGLWSAVRSAVGGDGSLIREEQLSYRAVIPCERLAADPMTSWVTERAQNTIWFGPNAHAVHFLISGGTHLCLVVQRAGTDARLDATPSLLVSSEEFVRAAPGWSPALLAMLAKADDDVLLQPLLHRAPDDAWVQGRIVLLGDAAHAMLPYQGQGGSQAIEDAGVLVHELAHAPESTGLGTALTRYRDRRYPKAAMLQRSSLFNKDFMHLPDGSAQQRRDTDLHARFEGDGDLTFDSMWALEPSAVTRNASIRPGGPGKDDFDATKSPDCQ